jgi:hypothetical protein
LEYDTENRKEMTMDDREILETALIGLQSQLGQINASMSDIRARLGIRGPRPVATSTDGAQPTPTKRTMSAAARKRIGEATRRRWIAFRKQKAEAAKPAAKPKRKMSAAGRAAIVAATKKRWAAVRAAKKAAAKKAAPVAKNTAAKSKARKLAAPAQNTAATSPSTT